MLDGKDALSQEEQRVVQAGRPIVQDHFEEGMTSLEDFWFFGFFEDEKIVAYDHTWNGGVKWLGISGLFLPEDEVKEDKIPIFREVLMYPSLLFACFVVVIFTPAKLLYTLMGIVTFQTSLEDYIVDNWNTFGSFIDAFYMALLSPWDVVTNFFILFPLDILLYFGQAFAWLGVNFPVLWFYSVDGF